MWKSPWTRWGAVLGLALGGFFDGILLHQILQWHHLFSLVPGLPDLRTQVLWDGYFHALMYAVAVIGLAGLWRAHKHAGTGWGRQLGGALLIGFGAWHILDSVLSHWLLGIHRIRIDSPNPLTWDLIWFFVFGMLPVIAGWRLGRGDRPSQPMRGATAAILALTAATAGAGAWAMRPPPDQPFTAVVFGPDISPPQVLATLAALDARLVWTGPAMDVVVVDVAPGRRWEFYGRGALLVSGSGVPAGCFDWSRA